MPPDMSPGTLAALGPHLWEVTWQLKGDQDGFWNTSNTTGRLVWAAVDEYRYERRRSGDLSKEEIRVANDVWRRGSEESRYTLTRALTGDSIILNETLRPWRQALAPLVDQIAYSRGEDTLIEGRTARVYRVQLAPQAAPRPGMAPEDASFLKPAVAVAVQGVVYVDEITGNRLLAEIEARWIHRSKAQDHELLDQVYLTFRERRSLTPLPPDITEPAAEDVIDRSDSARRRAGLGYPKAPERPSGGGGR